jgi:hypothetical protein
MGWGPCVETGMTYVFVTAGCVWPWLCRGKTGCVLVELALPMQLAVCQAVCRAVSPRHCRDLHSGNSAIIGTRSLEFSDC